MEKLTLIIKGEYLDQILTGEKLIEYREIRPNTAKKYCQHKDDEIVIKKGVIVPRKYDAIQFYAGYNKDRKSALVEIKSALVALLVDEDDNFIEYEENGKVYVMAQVEYTLGKVIECNFDYKKELLTIH